MSLASPHTDRQPQANRADVARPGLSSPSPVSDARSHSRVSPALAAKIKTRDEQIVRAYRAGTPQYKLATQFGISRPRVSRIVKRAVDARQIERLQQERRSVVRAERTAKVYALHQQGMSARQISKSLGMCPKTVQRALNAIPGYRPLRGPAPKPKRKPVAVSVPAWVWPQNHEVYREIAALPDNEEGGEEAAAAWARREQRSRKTVAEALAAWEGR